MGAAKDLIAIHAKLKGRVSSLEKSVTEYGASLKRMMVTLDQAADAIDLAEDESENAGKPVKDRQSKLDDVIETQRKKVIAAATEHADALGKVNAYSKLWKELTEDATKEVNKIKVKVK